MKKKLFLGDKRLSNAFHMYADPIQWVVNAASDDTDSVLKRGEMRSRVRLHLIAPLGEDMTPFTICGDGTGHKIKVVHAEEGTPTQGEAQADDVLHVTYEKLIPEAIAVDHQNDTVQVTLVTNKFPKVQMVKGKK
jgi:hypothetical protein